MRENVCATGSWGQVRLGWLFCCPDLPLNILFVILKKKKNYVTFSGVVWRGKDKWWNATWEVEGRKGSMPPVFIRPPFCTGPLPWTSPLSYQSPCACTCNAHTHTQTPRRHTPYRYTHTCSLSTPPLHTRVHTYAHRCSPLLTQHEAVWLYSGGWDVRVHLSVRNSVSACLWV